MINYNLAIEIIVFPHNNSEINMSRQSTIASQFPWNVTNLCKVDAKILWCLSHTHIIKEV